MSYWSITTIFANKESFLSNLHSNAIKLRFYPWHAILNQCEKIYLLTLLKILKCPCKTRQLMCCCFFNYLNILVVVSVFCELIYYLCVIHIIILLYSYISGIDNDRYSFMCYWAFNWWYLNGEYFYFKQPALFKHFF